MGSGMEGRDPDQKTEPTACALLGAILSGDPDDKRDPIAAQRFVTAECSLVILIRLKTGGENERIFDRHRGSLPSMGPDRVGSIAHQHDPAFVPARKRRHVIDRIASLNHLDMIEDPCVGARIVRMEGTDFPCVSNRIIDFFNIGLFGSIGIEPVDRLPSRLEISEERIAAERHPHQPVGIGNFGLGNSSCADQPRVVGLWIFGENHFTHTGPQTVRRDEYVRVMHAPIAERQPDTSRRCETAGHAHIEPNINTNGSRLREQDFGKKAAADRDARSAEFALMIRLVGKCKPLAPSVQNFHPGGVDAVLFDCVVAADRSQSVTFNHNTFDKALAINSMQVWSDVKAGLKEMWRVMKPGLIPPAYVKPFVKRSEASVSSPSLAMKFCRSQSATGLPADL